MNSAILMLATVALLGPLISAFAKQSAADVLNARYAAGKKDATSISEAGVLLHQSDNSENPKAPWMPCPKSDWSCQPDERFRFSASVISASIPFNSTPAIPIYNGGLDVFGLIFKPNNTVFCQYPQDGGTFTKVCTDSTRFHGCIPGCNVNRYLPTAGETCWCDDSCHSDVCAFKPNETAKMLANMIPGTSIHPGYNEVVVDAQTYAANMPGSLDAIFYLEGGRDAKAEEVHQKYLAAYGVTASEMPLVAFDVTNIAKPFRCAVC